jgi:hypothetical protein
LGLQADLQGLDKAIETTKATVSHPGQQESASELLEGLSRTYERLKTKVESLYAALNITPVLPELKGVDPEFIQTLFMAWDLKISICK